MTKIVVKPHADLCPDGAEFEAPAGTSLCDALLDNGVEIDHACGKSGACTTCHVLVRKGYATLSEISEKEEDMLDRAWGLEPVSRLSCQAILDDEEVEVEIPKYSINLVSEGH